METPLHIVPIHKYVYLYFQNTTKELFLPDLSAVVLYVSLINYEILLVFSGLILLSVIHRYDNNIMIP